jgi:hypothetical protein
MPTLDEPEDALPQSLCLFSLVFIPRAVPGRLRRPHSAGHVPGIAVCVVMKSRWSRRRQSDARCKYITSQRALQVTHPHLGGKCWRYVRGSLRGRPLPGHWRESTGQCRAASVPGGWLGAVSHRSARTDPEGDTGRCRRSCTPWTTERRNLHDAPSAEVIAPPTREHLSEPQIRA